MVNNTLETGLPVRNEVKAGYKQTEVGIIPIDWEVKKFSELGESIIGLTYNPSNVKPYGTLVLRSSNVQNGKLAFENNVFVDMELPKRVIVKENDVLICVRNGSKQLIGKCALIDKNTAGSAFGAFMSIYRSEFSKFVFHQFQSFIIQKQINETLGATINQITNKDLASFQVPLPPTVEEQTAIAQALYDTDELISSLEKLIAKKRNIKQGAMQQLLTGKKRLPGFSGEWETKKLGDVAEFYSGGTPSTSVSEYYNGEIPWITSSDLNECFIYSVLGRITKKGLANSSSKMIKKGTLLVALYGATAGVTAISFIDAAINQAVLAIIPIKENSLFLYYKLSSNKQWIINTYTQGGQPNLSGNIIKELEFPLPQHAEQTAIAQILSDMDSEIETLEKKRDKYKAIKQGMMQELLTGRIRLVKPKSETN